MTASRICSGRRSARPADVGVADSGKTGEELTVVGFRNANRGDGSLSKKEYKERSQEPIQEAGQPWSVPRLRGRGEQGKIARYTPPFGLRSIGNDSLFTHTQERGQLTPLGTSYSLAHHGVA